MGNKGSSPPAVGVRLEWEAVPEQVRSAVEHALGSKIAEAVSQHSGFSPGVAARLRLADGRRVFLKAASPELNPDTPDFHRREARNVAVLPTSAPVPRLLWSFDDGEWVVLVFEDIEGQHPAQPWDLNELHRVIDSLVMLGNALTPSPVSAGITPTASDHFRTRIYGWQRLIDEQTQGLDEWSVRHLKGLAEIEARAPAAVAGETLLHFDVRADNMLLTPEQVWIVDWPHACIGAAWLDIALFAPSVTMQGGPEPETILARHPAYQTTDPDAITAAIVSFAGLFTHRALQPPPPGLPTLRAFQAALGMASREWVAQRMGWK